MRLLIFSILAAAAVLGVLAEKSLDDDWQHFKKMFHKNYSKTEEPEREHTFYLNLKFIKEHNKKALEGKYTFLCGINEYADMTIQEFREKMNGYKIHAHRHQRIHGDPFTLGDDVDSLPAKVDWRKKRYVTDIKNQQQCGSCWAFSATGSVEGQHFKATGKLVSLSEQNLMDCSWKQGNMGCNGGLMDQAFEYIKENGGIDTEKSYPYEAQDGSCRFKKEDIGATISSYIDVPSGSELSLQKAVATIGPISVAIDASQMSFQLYQSGVYVEDACSTTSLDHGVLAVGYGNEKNQDYWLVKNSWGNSWGEKGYIKMARNHNNMCGIATQASYPVV